MEKYDVISVVGEGSYGLVMRCRHRESGQYVAIKKFLETEDDPTVRKMAMREIRMLKKLRHDNLVNMLEVFRRKKRFFLVFEYLEHTVLEELEARAGGLGYVISRKYCYQVLRALDFIHAHNVIHRDIKPENVLVSRLGVIKLCDFGFARPYAENETFTDYVATRWYRSPELLVGDPRYGKEVDIWAVGCLYAEMMTGEPLFPGESDIDQLFQIIRVIGKLNARHQLLVTRNTMFKGMKQEQNTSLHQMFPDWNRDCHDFLAQCLKMDGNQRPDTAKLLKHELFTRDNFIDLFMVELRTKLSQELQGNPLLKRLPGYGSGRKMSDAKKSGGGERSKKSGEEKFAPSSTTTTTKDRASNQIGLSLGAAQFSSKPNDSVQRRLSNGGIGGSGPHSEEISLNLNALRQYLNQQQQKQHKSIAINNLVFKDSTGSSKYSSRPVLSAKQTEKGGGNNVDLHIQPPSPVQFQSLQTDSLISDPANYQQSQQQSQRRLSPVSVQNLSISGNPPPQYFSQKRSSNILGLQQVSSHQKTTFKPSSIIQSNAMASTKKRDRPLIDMSLMPLGGVASTSDSLKDISPRILPPPPWLTGNLKITSQAKQQSITQIGKRTLTDWKSIGSTTHYKMTPSSTIEHAAAASSQHDFMLPDCPGATISPYKASGKKKLSPMLSLSTEHHSHMLNSPNNLTTPRNQSASINGQQES